MVHENLTKMIQNVWILEDKEQSNQDIENHKTLDVK